MELRKDGKLHYPLLLFLFHLLSKLKIFTVNNNYNVGFFFVLFCFGFQYYDYISLIWRHNFMTSRLTTWLGEQLSAVFHNK